VLFRGFTHRCDADAVACFLPYPVLGIHSSLYPTARSAGASDPNGARAGSGGAAPVFFQSGHRRRTRLTGSMASSGGCWTTPRRLPDPEPHVSAPVCARRQRSDLRAPCGPIRVGQLSGHLRCGPAGVQRFSGCGTSSARGYTTAGVRKALWCWSSAGPIPPLAKTADRETWAWGTPNLTVARCPTFAFPACPNSDGQSRPVTMLTERSFLSGEPSAVAEFPRGLPRWSSHLPRPPLTLRSHLSIQRAPGSFIARNVRATYVIVNKAKQT
jgi:hypothetical protein